MTGGPFALEKVAKAIWLENEAWMSRFALPATRARATAVVAIIGIFIASFLAFNDERNALQTAQGELKNARGYASNPYPPLTPAQLQKLSQAFHGLPRPSFFIVTVTADRSSADLAEQIRKTLKPVIGTVNVQPGWLSGEDSGCGVCFEVVDAQKLNPQQKVFLKAFMDADIRAKVTSSFDADQLKGIDFVLFIGPKRD